MRNVYKEKEQNDLITSLTISRKDLEKIIELESDVPVSLKELLEKNKDTEAEIRITDINDIIFIYNLNWIVDEYMHDFFSETEVEIAIKYVNGVISKINEKAEICDKETLKLLKTELKKYKYMLAELRKVLTLRRKEPPKRI